MNGTPSKKNKRPSLSSSAGAGPFTPFSSVLKSGLALTRVHMATFEGTELSLAWDKAASKKGLPSPQVFKAEAAGFEVSARTVVGACGSPAL